MKNVSQPKEIRCAVYTRKSVDEGLDLEMNTLTVQREAAEAYIESQRGEGWRCLETQYDDGGYTGGNIDRPALQRLLEDIKAGRVDCVVVYKVDRLSRSLLDFAKLSELFDQHGVSFVSVTQQINTGNSMGKLMLNVLLSFAQFEREIIGERTKDRMAAARRKGRWIGGRPFLGYDVAPEGRALVVNELEARQVRRAFEVYLEERSLSQSVRQLRSEGIRLKQWVTRSGKTTGGSMITKGSLHGMLSNVAYIGKVSYEGELIDGAHDAILAPEVFEATQRQLKENDRTGGIRVRNKHDALLRGLVRCKHCGTAMSHSFTKKKSGKIYRYYVCQTAMKEGWSVCPTKSVAAGDIEGFVVDRIKALGSDAELQQEVIGSFLKQQSERDSQLQADQKRLAREYRGLQQKIQNAIEEKQGATEFALLEGKLKESEAALQSISAQLTQLREDTFDSETIARALSLFTPVWEQLSTTERCDLLGLLIEQVQLDGEAGELEIIWKEDGIHALLENK